MGRISTPLRWHHRQVHEQSPHRHCPALSTILTACRNSLHLQTASLWMSLKIKCHSTDAVHRTKRFQAHLGARVPDIRTRGTVDIMGLEEVEGVEVCEEGACEVVLGGAMEEETSTADLYRLRTRLDRRRLQATTELVQRRPG